MLLCLFGCFISSCENKTKECVRGLMDEGYSYDKAWDICEDAAAENQIR